MMKSLSPTLLIFGAVLLLGCATTPEASQRVLTQPENAPAEWEARQTNPGSAALLYLAYLVGKAAFAQQ
jgi:hypothetical protein